AAAKTATPERAASEAQEVGGSTSELDLAEVEPVGSDEVAPLGSAEVEQVDSAEVMDVGEEEVEEISGLVELPEDSGDAAASEEDALELESTELELVEDDDEPPPPPQGSVPPPPPGSPDGNH
ncbi:MAG: hypothetical protein ACOCUS_06305, partial [Polyangiales bacterium]